MSFGTRTAARHWFGTVAFTWLLVMLGLLAGISSVLFPLGIVATLIGLPLLMLLWVMPDLAHVPKTWAKKSLFVFLFVTMSLPIYVAVIIPGVPMLSPRRFITYGVALLSVYVVSASSIERTRFWAKLSAVPKLRNFLFGYIAICFFSLLISSNPTATATGLFNASITWFIPALAVVNWVEKADDIKKLFAIFIGCLILDALLGVIEFRLQFPPLWRILPAASRSYAISMNPLWQGLETGSWRGSDYRSVSAYTVSLSWAEMAGMMSPIAAYYLFHGPRASSRLIGMLGLLSTGVSIFCSGSRGGYACTIAGLSTFVLAWAFRRLLLDKRSLVGPILVYLAAGAVLVVGLSIIFVDRIRFTVIGGGSTASSDMGRELQWAAAWPKIMASPLWGYGLGNAPVIVNYRTGYGDTLSLDDYRINVLVDTGLIGAVLFYGVLILATYYCIRAYISAHGDVARYGAGVAGSLVAYLTYQLKLSQIDNMPLVMMDVGLAFVIWRGRNVVELVSQRGRGERNVGVMSDSSTRKPAPLGVRSREDISV